MKRLILMRHAKSSWANIGQSDIDRPLNKRGFRSAALIGNWLRENGFVPDYALVSTARRTQQTWEGVVSQFGAAPQMQPGPALYDASAETIFSLIRSLPDDPQSALLLAHQPGMGYCARALLADPPENPDFDRYPTASTTVMDFDIANWAEIAWQTGKLVDFVIPRALEAA